MYKVHYRTGRSALVALFLAGLAFAFMQARSEVAGGWIPFMLGMILAVGAAKAAYDALTDAPALVWDASGVSIRRGFRGTTVVPWRMVQGFAIEVQTTRYMLVIPIARHEFLTVLATGGISGTKRLRLHGGMLRLPPGGVAALVQDLTAAHMAAMRGAPDVQWSENGARLASEPASEREFDADAALARYLARKEAASEPQMADASARTAAAAAVPARPVFGRKSQAR